MHMGRAALCPEGQVLEAGLRWAEHTGTQSWRSGPGASRHWALEGAPQVMCSDRHLLAAFSWGW